MKNKTKIFLLALLLIGSLTVLTNAAKADYTDYVNGQVVKVQYVSHKGADFTFKVVLPDGSSQIVKGGLDENGRGVPDLSGISTGPLANQTIKPPSRKQVSASFIDSSERREQQFRETYPEAIAKNIMIGYDATKTFLAPDQNASLREILTVAIRTTAAQQGIDTYIKDPNLAWKEAGEVAEEFLRKAGESRDLTIIKVQELINTEGFNLVITDRNGDGIVQREELLQSVSQSGSQGQTSSPPRQPQTPPSSPPPSSPPQAAAPSCTFTATRPKILYNQISKLTWNCVNATTCSIDQGVGTNLPSSGEKEVEPKKSTLYTLTCSGPGGQIQKTTEVSVFGIYLEETRPE